MILTVRTDLKWSDPSDPSKDRKTIYLRTFTPGILAKYINKALALMSLQLLLLLSPLQIHFGFLWIGKTLSRLLSNNLKVVKWPLKDKVFLIKYLFVFLHHSIRTIINVFIECFYLVGWLVGWLCNAMHINKNVVQHLLKPNTYLAYLPACLLTCLLILRLYTC